MLYDLSLKYNAQHIIHGLSYKNNKLCKEIFFQYTNYGHYHTSFETQAQLYGFRVKHGII